MRTIFWDYQEDQLKMIDQRRLPEELVIYSCQTSEQCAEAIRTMVIRGAPAIGVCGAFGLALAARRCSKDEPGEIIKELEKAFFTLQQCRPTAINLIRGLTKIMDEIKNQYRQDKSLKDFILEKAQQMADEDVRINKQMAEIGALLINDGDTIIHHCNTGALATVDWGTALGVIRTAHEQGKRMHLLVDETRPQLQGARLTAWELEQYGIEYEIISDNMAGHFLQTGKVNKVLFGADRVAANGDVVNKIGSYMLALAAKDNQVPVYSVVPTSSFDLNCKTGKEIPIEERNQDEVLDISLFGNRAAPKNAKARNPAFDVTSNKLISAIITEKGIIYPPYNKNISDIVDA